MPTFDPSAEAAGLNARIDGPRQSTPVMQPKLAAATPFSPEVRELASELFDRVEVVLTNATLYNLYFGKWEWDDAST